MPARPRGVTRRAQGDVVLIAEGTYPYHHGGVTVWCDQLVRGLPETRFSVIALEGADVARPVVRLPANVLGVHPIRVWGSRARPRRAGRGPAARAVADAHEWLLATLTPDEPDPERGFRGALGRLHQLSRSTDVAAILRDEPAVRRVHAAMLRGIGGVRGGGGGAIPSLRDALIAGDLIEHMLRPLWTPPPRARIVHCVSNGLAALVGMAAKWSDGTPMILTEHGVYLRERYLAADADAYAFHVRALLLRFFRLLTGVSYGVADLIVPGSEYNVRWQTRTGADHELIHPVHNGVDPQDFPIAGDEPVTPTLTWVGRVDPLKDLETLIRAFALVRDDVPDARLRMFGPTPPPNRAYHERCERLIAALGLRGAATFEGRVERITDAYRAGHVVVLSSASEGFPYTLIEAMASARATVSTDVGGVREAVGDAGVVVPPRDVPAMAEACIGLLRDDARRGRLAAEARARIIDRFTLARFLDVYGGIYRDVADGRAVVRSSRTPSPLELVA